MKDNLFSIGELSKLKGMTIKTLRFYDEIGLIQPHYTDPFTKYRYYSSDQFIQIDIIKALKSMDVSTKDIAKIIKEEDTDKMICLLSEQKEALKQKILEIKNAISLIDVAQTGIENSRASLANDSIFYKHMDIRYMLTYPLKDLLKKNSLMVTYSKLYKIIEDKDLMNTYDSGCLYERVNSNYIPCQYFSTVKLKDSSRTEDLLTIPGGRFLCICFSKDNFEEKLTQLNQYIESNNYEPLFVLHVELINEVFSDTEHFEIQILIEENES